MPSPAKAGLSFILNLTRPPHPPPPRGGELSLCERCFCARRTRVGSHTSGRFKAKRHRRTRSPATPSKTPSLEGGLPEAGMAPLGGLCSWLEKAACISSDVAAGYTRIHVSAQARAQCMSIRLKVTCGRARAGDAPVVGASQPACDLPPEAAIAACERPEH